MLGDELEEFFHLTSIVEDLGTSPIDTDNLVNKTSDPFSFHIGMDNFRAKKVKSSNKSPSKASNSSKPIVIQSESLARQRWKLALKKLRKIEDPWAKFKIADYPEEVVVRHRYNPVKNEWKRDENIIKMEAKQFANGAMRSCYRL